MVRVRSKSPEHSGKVASTFEYPETHVKRGGKWYILLAARKAAPPPPFAAI